MSPYAIAVLFTLASTALYALGYALAKVLAESLHPFEITFLRSALVLASVLALTMVKPAPAATIKRIALPKVFCTWVCNQKTVCCFACTTDCTGRWHF